MSKFEKQVLKLLSGNADTNFTFNELRALLIFLSFKERVSGSHHIFTKAGVVGIINIQKDKNGKAKPYQVKQVRDFLINNRLIQI